MSTDKIQHANDWYITSEQLLMVPSVLQGLNPEGELLLRIKTAQFIGIMGRNLRLTDQCIFSAILIMHRFYLRKSFLNVDRYELGSAAIYISASVQQSPITIVEEHLKLLGGQLPESKQVRESYIDDLQTAVELLQAVVQDHADLGIYDHPHHFIEEYMNEVRAAKPLADKAYHLATYLYLKTVFCVMYTPEIIACFCIYKVFRESPKKFPPNVKDEPFYMKIDAGVDNIDIFEMLYDEFYTVCKDCPKDTVSLVSNILDGPPEKQNASLKTKIISAIPDKVEKRKYSSNGRKVETRQTIKRKGSVKLENEE